MVLFKYLNRHTINYIFLFLIFSITVQAQKEDILFNHLWVEDGLSQSTIFSIYKDQKGFVWLGTRRGLNRYDGFQFKHFMHQMSDSNSLSSNVIYSIIGDSKDNLIIQTDKELNYFDRYKQKFAHIPVNGISWNFTKDNQNKVWTCSSEGVFVFNEDKKALDVVENEFPFTGLYDLVFDNEDNLWITGENSVIQYNTISQKYKSYEISNANQLNIFIAEANNGEIWLCLNNGSLLCYNESKDLFEEKIEIEKPGNLLVSSFGLGLGNTLVVGTDGNGVNIVNTQDLSLKNYNHQADNPKSLSSNTYYSVFADKKLDILWLGSYMGGLDYYSKYNKGLHFIYHQPNNGKSIVNNNIRSLYFDNASKLLWVGTRQGISVLDTLNNVVRNYTQEELRNKGITKPIITKIWKDPLGYIWLCTYKGGIAIYDSKVKKLKNSSEIYPELGLPANLGVFDILVDSRKNTWVATDEGTYLIPQNKKAFVFNPLFSKVILEDRAGRVFIGTAYNGLLMVNNALQTTAVSFSQNEENNYNERINSLLEDKDGNIWVSTGGNGIYNYNPYDNTTEKFTTKDGLPDNYIAGIAIDTSGALWISTYTSIARYQKNNKVFKNVFMEKGIIGKEFNPNSIALDPNGSIYIGSINGLLKFNTKHYRENPFLPKVTFTEIYINDNKISATQKKSPLKNNIMFVNRIDLKHFQNTITLEFTAPEYYLGDKVKFLYKIEDETSNWVSLGNNRSLNLVNLNPGKYNINVKAVNSDGHSTLNGTQLTLNIAPPPWKTIYAYLFYILFIGAILIMIRRFSRSKLKLKYELLLQKTKNEKNEEINQSRIRLFTDISHEIGNSLTVMNLPLETLNNIEVDNLKKHYISVINNNVNRLVNLVKRIIDLRKIETGNMPLRACSDDLIAFIKNVCVNFESYARKKKIHFVYDFKESQLITWFDKEKVEYILFNLLSNAFKYEPEEGTVIVQVLKDNTIFRKDRKQRAIIRVQNTGSFIPPEIAGHIFERFYSGGDKSFSSGIGLSLTKSYVLVHKGEISFTSDKIEGVTFEVILPYGESYLSADEKLIDAPVYEIGAYGNLEQESDVIEYKPELEEEEAEKHKMLIIENNIDLLHAVKEKLISNYELIDAADEEDGLIKARNFQPDIIIIGSFKSDSNTSGHELCRYIKRDVEINHIPVIILSAQDDIEEKIKSMESGADFFMTKPFSFVYLKSISKNLINLRNSLKKKFNYKDIVSEKEIDLTAVDERFLEKTYSILDENIDNVQFGIPEFIDQLGVSKYMFYSKIKSLTGQTPNDFILSYKLKIASNTLRKKNITDIEIYEKLGFSDISYFRKCFKKFYGMTPNQYKKSVEFLEKDSKKS